MSNSLRPHGLQHARLPCPWPTPRACSNSCPWSRWCHPTISSCCPLLLPPSIFPESRFFFWVSSSHQVAKVLEFQLQHQSLTLSSFPPMSFSRFLQPPPPASTMAPLHQDCITSPCPRSFPAASKPTLGFFFDPLWKNFYSRFTSLSAAALSLFSCPTQP